MKTISIFFLVTALPGLALRVPAQVVTIPDPGLEAAIRFAVGKPTGDITIDDMVSLTNLYARNRAIVSIEGLGTATNLAWLDL